MVSTIPHDNCIGFHGLSTGCKPTKNIYNGSVFVEVDTTDQYFFDGKNKKWLKYSGGMIELLTAINEHTYQFVGLSTDKKPTDCLVDTGSRFIEMDTSKTFMYYKPEKKWMPFNTGLKEYIAGENITISGNVISAKDTTYSAGKNIEISEDNIISANGVEAILTKAIEAAFNVGGVYIGQRFAEGTTLEEIIRVILTGLRPKVGQVFWGTFDEVPEGITGEFISEDISEDVLINGIRHHYTTTGFQYECIVYPMKLGPLTKIFQNDMEFFNLVSNYICKEITYEGEEYYLCYYVDPVKTENDLFHFNWAPAAKNNKKIK